MAALNDFARYVRPEVPMCSDLQISDAVLHAGIEFCRRTKLVQEDVDLDTEIGVPAYDLTTLLATGFEPDEILVVKRSGFGNLEGSSQEDAFNYLEFTQTGEPHMYYLADRNAVLVPTPEAVETLQLTVKVRPSEAATTLPDELYRRYRTEIAAGAKAFLMLQANQPWSNPQAGSIHKFTFDAAVSAENLRYAKGGGSKALRSVINRF